MNRHGLFDLKCDIGQYNHAARSAAVLSSFYLVLLWPRVVRINNVAAVADNFRFTP